VTWVKLDDGFPRNRKVINLTDKAFRLHVSSLCHCAAHLTDGALTDRDVRQVAALIDMSRPARYVAELRDAGLWLSIEGGYEIHDYLEFNPTREQVLAQRERNAGRQKLFRDPKLRLEIRQRDGDLCRYCGKKVSWSDRRSSRAGSYDHVVPGGPTTFENLVVACRGCNSRKGSRTPDEAGMELLPASGSSSELVPVLNLELDSHNGPVPGSPVGYPRAVSEGAK
jgi:hypothetical protein